MTKVVVFLVACAIQKCLKISCKTITLKLMLVLSKTILNLNLKSINLICLWYWNKLYAHTKFITHQYLNTAIEIWSTVPFNRCTWLVDWCAQGQVFCLNQTSPCALVAYAVCCDARHRPADQSVASTEKKKKMTDITVEMKTCHYRLLSINNCMTIPHGMPVA